MACNKHSLSRTLHEMIIAYVPLRFSKIGKSGPPNIGAADNSTISALSALSCPTYNDVH